jgi:hypothetical protein
MPAPLSHAGARAHIGSPAVADACHRRRRPLCARTIPFAEALRACEHSAPPARQLLTAGASDQSRVGLQAERRCSACEAKLAQARSPLPLHAPASALAVGVGRHCPLAAAAARNALRATWRIRRGVRAAGVCIRAGRDGTGPSSAVCAVRALCTAGGGGALGGHECPSRRSRTRAGGARNGARDGDRGHAGAWRGRQQSAIVRRASAIPAPKYAGGCDTRAAVGCARTTLLLGLSL